MKPPPFELLEPREPAEAVEMLAHHRGSARLLAGGQSLVPLLNLRFLRPAILIDLNRAEGLSEVRLRDGMLELGAMVRQSTIERSPEVAAASPLLVEATRHIGYRAIRNRGTVGGSLAHADPGAEYPAALLALDGEVVVHGGAGERRVAAGDLFAGPFRTSLAEDELLAAVRVPALRADQSWAFLELCRRYHSHTIAGVAVVLTWDADGRCSRCRIALAGVGDTPLRRPAAEAALEGAAPTSGALAEAAHLAAEGLEPPDELHAPGDYKRAMAQVLVSRALRQAVERRGASLP